MVELRISSARLKQGLHCKCGRAITPGDIRCQDERIDIVCSGCHAELIEVEFGVFNKGGCSWT